MPVPPLRPRALAGEYMAAIDAELDRLAALLDQDLAAFNRLVAEADLPPVDTGEAAPGTRASPP